MPGGGISSVGAIPDFDVAEIRAGALADLAGDKNQKALEELAGKSGIVASGSLSGLDAGAIKFGTLSDLLSEEDREALKAGNAKVSEAILSRLGGIEVFNREQKEHLLSLGRSLFEETQRWDGETAPSAAVERDPEERPAPKRRRRAPAQEQIARRVFKRQRQAAVSFLRAAGLKTELDELGKVEAEVAKGSKRSCMHAAYSARVLLEGLADYLFPPVSEKRKSRDGQMRALGASHFKNRLIAYVEDQLDGHLEGADFRAFVGTLDAVMNWTGGGPHGSHGPQDAEHLYTRMLDALSVIARAHAVKAG